MASSGQVHAVPGDDKEAEDKDGLSYRKVNTTEGLSVLAFDGSFNSGLGHCEDGGEGKGGGTKTKTRGFEVLGGYGAKNESAESGVGGINVSHNLVLCAIILVVLGPTTYSLLT